MTSRDSHWHSDIEAPRTIDNADVLPWDSDTDVAVVGAGAAGASAAIEARDAGARVMLLDRFAGGGASGLSGGVIYLGGGTQYQRASGHDDTPENMFNYLKLETRGIVSDDTLRAFCNGSVDTLRWLESNGVPFDGTLHPAKTSYPTDRYYLYHSGNELLEDFTKAATPAPRGHRVKWKGRSGVGMMQALLQSCRHKGVDMKTQTRVTQLVQTPDGKIVGLKTLTIPEGSSHARRLALYYDSFNKINMYAPRLARALRRTTTRIENRFAVTRLVRARKGVILATGGFIFNRAMAKHHAPRYASGAPLGSLGCNGDGIRLGESAGGVTDNMDGGSAWRFIDPPNAWTRGVIVNLAGRRFVNEQSYGARIGEFMCEHNDGKGILIYNGKLCRDMFSQLVPGKAWLMLQVAPALLSFFFNTRKADTLEELAVICRLPADNLKDTIARYNIDFA